MEWVAGPICLKSCSGYPGGAADQAVEGVQWTLAAPSPAISQNPSHSASNTNTMHIQWKYKYKIQIHG